MKAKWGQIPVALRPTGALILAISGLGGMDGHLLGADAGAVVSWGSLATLPDDSTNVISVASGRQFDFGLSLLSDRTVRGWGRNDGGQTTVPPDLTDVVQVVGGWNYALARRANGRVVFWGTYWYGEYPQPSNLTNIVDLAAGWCHSLALTREGNVIGWGWNASGQATPPIGLSNVVAVAAGEKHSLALRSDGTVVAWGDNQQRQSTVPAGLAGVAAIAAGSTHSLALRSNGTVTAWGESTHGQASPPPGLSNVVAIAAGNFHSMALKGDGTVVNFGSEPSLPGLSNVTSVAAGTFSSYAVTLNPVFPWHGQPGATNVPDGGGLFLSARVLSTGPVSWQWQFNGTNLLSATNQTYSTEGVRPEHQGLYRVLARNSRGATVSAAAYVSTYSAEPWIISEPADSVFSQGASVTLIAHVGGSERMMFQWLRDGSPLGGATNTTLFIPSVGAADDGYYSLVASNALGMTMTTPALLAVEPLAFAAGPTSQTVAAGAVATFAVRAAGARPIEYQWRLFGTNLPGQTNSMLTLGNTQASHAGGYDVVIWNESGSLTSAVAQLTVEAKAPSLAMPPLGPVRREGELALLLARVQGSEPLHLHWRLDGGILPGATNQSLALHRLRPSDAGSYRLVASNSVGVVTSAPVSVVVRPVEPSLAVGWGTRVFGLTAVSDEVNNVLFATAAPRHNILWRSDDQLLGVGALDLYPDGYPPGPPGLSNVVALASGSYFNAFLHGDGSASAWMPAYLDRPETYFRATGIVDVVAIAATPEHVLLLRRNGDVLRWSMQVEYLPPEPTGLSNIVAVTGLFGKNLALRQDGSVVEWFDDAMDVDEVQVVEGATGLVAIAAGSAHGLGLRDDGTVMAWGWDGLGQLAVPTDLADVVAVAASEFGSIALRQNGTLEMWGSLSTPPPDGDLPAGLADVQTVAGGMRHYIALTPAPFITNQPISKTVFIGGSATFHVGARSVTPLRYQWQLDGVNIPGATNSAFTLEHVQLFQAGTYSVILATARHQVTSASAELLINPFEASGVTFTTAAWGDFDNDGRQDLLTDGGDGTSPGPPPRLFGNRGDGSFERIDASLAENSARCAWADLDNDGWLDAITSGLSGVQISRNRGDGTFTKLPVTWSADFGSAVTTQDFDRDGKIDLAFGSRLYRNLGNNTFAAIPLDLANVGGMAGDWGDFDRDGWPDYLINGVIQGNTQLKLMRNLGGGEFTSVEAGLPNLYLSAVAFGDLDGDGWLDVVLSGEVPSTAQSRTVVYRNRGDGTLSNLNVNLPQLSRGHASLIDYDNDGYPDLFLGGRTTGGDWQSGIFRNNGAGQFTPLAVTLNPPAIFGAWGDYDQDGRPDLAYGGILSPTETSAFVLRSRVPVANTPPTAPQGMQAVSHLNSVVFQWNPATDAQTPAAALTYNVRVGSSPGDVDLLAPGSLPTGTRQVPAPGNAGPRPALLLTNLSFGRYYWSVQTVDGAFAGSAFAPEQVINYAAVTLPASNFTPTTVTLHGRMDTNRSPVSARFEWGQDRNLSNAVNVATIGSTVSVVLSNLTPGATYQFRLAVTNADGAAYGASETFRAPSAPEILAVASRVLGPDVAQLQVTANANGLPTIGYFEFGLDSNYGGRTPNAQLGSSSAPSSTEQMVSGLIGGSLHHYRVTLSNALGTATSPDQTFVTTPAPEAYTVSASALGSSSAVLNGRFRANNLAARVWFDYGPTTNYGAVTASTDIGDGTNFVPLAVFVGGLPHQASWHFRAVASNSYAIALGSNQSFTTLSDVITDPATGIGPTVARLEGRANPEGLSTSVWFEYGRTTNYGTVTPITAIGSGSNHLAVSAEMSGLERRTSYQFRLVSVNPVQTNYGRNASFTTSNDVYTLPATELSLFSARLNGALAPNGQANVAWFEYWRSGGLTNVTPRLPIPAGATPVSISQTVTGLVASGSYSARLWVSNATGLRWGDAVTFFTPWVLTSTQAPFPGQVNGAIVPADFDHDGRMDLLSVGTNSIQLITDVAGAALIRTLPFPGASPASVDVGDFDNDGWQDVLIAGMSSGLPSIRLLRNLGGTDFVQVATGLSGISSGAVRWGDFDHDGLLDILLVGQAGIVPVTRLYRNAGATGFVAAATTALPLVQETTAAWCDFNRDGHLDVAIAGRTGLSPFSVICRLYLGNGRGGFADANLQLPAMRSGSIDWGDYNNDGWPDLLLAGIGFSQSSFIRLLRNSGGTNFTEVSNPPQLAAEAVRWGDFDSDGWPDILVQGQRTFAGGVPTNSASALLRNGRNGLFEETRFPLPELTATSGGWADFNGDGRLDVIMSGTSRTGTVAMIYFNNGAATNSAPAPATSLTAAITNHSARLSWNVASDLQTPSPALTYSVRMQKLPDGPAVIAPVAETNGFRRVVRPGANGSLTSVQLESLMPGHYAWSVQTVDSAFAGSPFAPEAFFEVIAPEFYKVALLPDGRLALGFVGRPGTTYELESSVDLRNWSSVGLLGPLTNDVFETVRPRGASPRQFLRLKLRP